MRESKKSQITLFIILAVIIVAGAGFYFYATTIRNPTEPEVNFVQQQVPLEFDSIKKYAGDCIYAVASDGIRLMGKQGGYLSFKNKTLNSGSFTITNNP